MIMMMERKKKMPMLAWLSAIFEQGRLIAETDIARLHLKIHSCKQAQRNKSRRPADLFECKIDLPLRICEMLGMLTTKNEEAYSGCPVMSLRQGLFKGDQTIKAFYGAK
ncbi:uncharacterized protein LOC121050575 [Rosa chinensis]|uniref:uncharacterized protein LOC121050575 n=1 Tax=Rosa chinensis TaxID=74649 RepID=UPI001AD93097|nr:uncharacterized protein LOC121050575 [Rosa chinensis]